MDLSALGLTPALLPAAVPARRCPVGSGQLLNACRLVWERGGELAALWASDERDRERGFVVYVALRTDDGLVVLEYTLPGADAGCPDLAPIFPAANRMQRAAFDLVGVQSDSDDQRPWLWQASWPIDQFPLRRDFVASPKWEPGEEDYPFVRVAGDGVHEIPVGPVHAGIIEPGHFRFQCFGENVLHLEIQLGYQHRGAEELLLRSSPRRQMVIAESIAGDTAVGHGLAHCMALEALAGSDVPLVAQSIRGIALELERTANHVGDLGALCNDVGYLPGASWLGRLRGESLNLLMELSGSRFGRGLVRPGGVGMGIGKELRGSLPGRLAALERDLRDTADIVFGSPSVGARFEQTGILTKSIADDLGLVGPAARASGCDRDTRRDHPSGIYRFVHIPVALAETGDVMARALIRWLEAQRSIEFVHEQASELTEGALSERLPSLRAESVAVSMVEGWRGEIVHMALTNDKGKICAYKIIDPSLHNWIGLAMAVRGNQVSDFPLCNKSFNLSYAGHDL
jgi:Ni,Fe-hydrogenase III large subunit/Ni,Fe-hydrogenase III component G